MKNISISILDQRHSLCLLVPVVTGCKKFHLLKCVCVHTFSPQASGAHLATCNVVIKRIFLLQTGRTNSISRKESVSVPSATC